MLWESLVSEGHVRSVRLRRLQPWILGAGLLLIWLGIWVASLAPPVRSDSSVLSILQQRVAKARARAEAALAGVPRPALGPAESASLPPYAELPELIDTTLQSLERSGALPTDTLDFVETERASFWKGQWVVERVHYAKSGDFVLVAGYVNVGTATRPQPARWMGAFKKFGDKWQYGSLAGGGLYAPRPYPALRAGDLSLSMAPLLPDEP